MSEERFRAVPFRIYRLGPSEDLVQTLDGSPAIILNRAAGATLQLCNSLRTIAEHEAALCLALNNTDRSRSQARKILADLRQMKLVVSEDTFYKATQVREEDTETISTIGIVTADRPASCDRTFRAFTEVVRRHGRRTDYVIVDDSTSERNRALNVQFIRAACSDLGGTVYYAGYREKSRYVELLREAGIDPVLARFALLGENPDRFVTIGSNRNCLLLDTLGSCVLSVDDDIRPQSVAHPQMKDTVSFRGHVDARDYWFFEARNSLVNELDWTSVDLLGEHEKILTRSLAAMALEGQLGPEDPLSTACDHMIRSIFSGQARVMVTVGGIAGDSGERNYSWLSAASPGTMANLLHSADRFDCATKSREVLGVAADYTVTHRPFCQTANVGLDNRTGLPPFPPVGRGEDAAFGTLLLSSPNSFLGHIPFALLHEAEGGRTYESDYQLRFSEILRYLIASCANTSAISTTGGVSWIGSQLKELARLKCEDFWHETRHRVRCQMQDSIEAAGRNYSPECFGRLPEYWRRQVGQWHRDSVDSVRDPLRLIPQELRNRYQLLDATTRTKDLIGMMGRLLYEWPDILAASETIRNRGIRLSLPVS